MRLPFPLNLHSSRPLHAVSFFEGFQTPAGLEKTRAHQCGRHLKPITKAGMGSIFRGRPLNPQVRNHRNKRQAKRQKDTKLNGSDGKL